MHWTLGWFSKIENNTTYVKYLELRHYNLFCWEIVVNKTTCIWVGRPITDVSFISDEYFKVRNCLLGHYVCYLDFKTPEDIWFTFLKLLRKLCCLCKEEVGSDERMGYAVQDCAEINCSNAWHKWRETIWYSSGSRSDNHMLLGLGTGQFCCRGLDASTASTWGNILFPVLFWSKILSSVFIRLLLVFGHQKQTIVALIIDSQIQQLPVCW